MTTNDRIAAALDTPGAAQHVPLARSAPVIAMADDAWRWYAEWRLAVLTPAGRDALAALSHFESDRAALYGDRPTVLQERRVDIAPDGALHPRPWQSYHPNGTPWDAVWNNGTGVVRAPESLHPFHAFAVARDREYAALAEELRRLVQQRDRVRPPDLHTRAGQAQDQAERNERGVRALKEARLYTRWRRALKDPAALSALEPQLAPIRERVLREHEAARAEALAEVARLGERIDQIAADLPWLASGADAPPLFDTDPLPEDADRPPAVDHEAQLWRLVAPSGEEAQILPPWMRRVGPGDLVVLTRSATAPVRYACLTAAPAGAERRPQERDAHVFSRDRVHGAAQVISVAQVALVLTEAQFAAVRAAGWPDRVDTLWAALELLRWRAAA